MSMCISANERDKKERRVKKRKGTEALRVKHLTSSLATDALIGDEEQDGKRKRTKRNKMYELR